MGETVNNAADTNAEGTTAEGTTQETTMEETATETKTYTEAELNQLKADWEKDWQQKLDEAAAAGKKAGISEAERLAQLTETERLQEQLKAAQEENEQYKTAENRRSLEAEAVKTLAAEGLPEAFAQMVLGENAEAIKANITAVKTAFHQAVQTEVENRIKGKTPSAGGGVTLSESDKIKAEVNKIMKGAR